jgi:hypothetical protein
VSENIDRCIPMQFASLLIKPSVISSYHALYSSYFRLHHRARDVLPVVGCSLRFPHRSLFVRPQLSLGTQPVRRTSATRKLRPTDPRPLTSSRYTQLGPRFLPVQSVKMAAAIKALNAKIRSNKYTDYFCSTRTYSTLFLVGALRSGRAWEGRDK